MFEHLLPEEFGPNQRWWVNEMLTTDKLRAHHALHNLVKHAYCCLGLVCDHWRDQVSVDTTDDAMYGLIERFNDQTGDMPWELAAMVGLHGVVGHFINPRDGSRFQLALEYEWGGDTCTVEATSLAQLNDNLSLRVEPHFKLIAEFVLKNRRYIFKESK